MMVAAVLLFLQHATVAVAVMLRAVLTVSADFPMRVAGFCAPESLAGSCLQLAVAPMCCGIQMLVLCCCCNGVYNILLFMQLLLRLFGFCSSQLLLRNAWMLPARRYLL